MKAFFRKIWGDRRARKAVFIGLLSLTGIGGGVATMLGTALDEGVEQYETATEAEAGA